MFMKKIIILMLALMPAMTYAQRFVVNGFLYEILSEEELTVSLCGSYPKSMETLIIPETVSYDNKVYTVTDISDIGLLNIDPHYPAGVSDVKAIILPPSIKTTVTFYGLTLEEIIVDEDNQWLSSHEGVLYSKDCKILHLCPRLNRFTAFQPGVERIGVAAFGGCKYIEDIMLPNTVNWMGRRAFRYSKIRNVIMPEGIEIVPEGCFEGCEQLATVSLPESLKYVEDFAFNNDYKIETIYCRAEQTPSCGDFIFEDQTYNNTILYIPVGGLESYQNTYPWSLFKNIKEYDYSSNTPVEAAGIDIRAEGGAIVVSGNEAVPVEVYRTDGTLVRRTAESRINGLPRGLYIVKVAGSIKKVAL